jgi:hypothetical protein
VLDSNNITSMLPKNVSTTYRHILISGGITILMFGKGHIKHPSFYKMIKMFLESYFIYFDWMFYPIFTHHCWYLIFVEYQLNLFCSLWFDCLLMVFNATFINISVLLVEETKEPGKNHRPVASHWETLSHNVVHIALIEIRTSNISGGRHWLHR